MVLVLLGTQNNDFSRLLNKIEELKNKNIIKDEIVVQSGHTKFKSNNMKIFDFMPTDEINSLMEKSDLIITHGGVGSITSGMKLNKKVIAVARLKEYGEHVNNHQIQIIEAFDSNKYIKGITNMDDLEDAVKNIDSFIPNKYISNTEEIKKIIIDFIENN